MLSRFLSGMLSLYIVFLKASGSAVIPDFAAVMHNFNPPLMFLRFRIISCRRSKDLQKRCLPYLFIWHSLIVSHCTLRPWRRCDACDDGATCTLNLPFFRHHSISVRSARPCTSCLWASSSQTLSCWTRWTIPKNCVEASSVLTVLRSAA